MKAIVCGAGRVGRQIARRLAMEKADVTVIDAKEEMVRRAVSEMDVTGVEGMASQPSVLERAGAHDADILIAATRSDEVNMMACQVAYSIFSVPQKIARIRSSGYLDPRWRSMFRSQHMPVDEVIYPEQDVANSVSHWLNAPMATEVMPFLGGKVQFVGLRLGEDCPVLDQPLRHLSELFEGLHTIVVAAQRGNALLIPGGDDVLREGDVVQFIAQQEEVSRTLSLFGYEMEPVRQVVVVGGGSVGAAIAGLAARKGRSVRVRLVERNEQRAREVAQRHPTVGVICGNALDAGVLEDAQVGSASAVVAVTDDDQANVLAAAMAKERGAKRALSLVTKDAFRSIAQRLSIDSTINPETATISSIIAHVRRGSVQAMHSVQHGRADLIEAKAMKSAVIVGKFLRDSPFPNRSRIGAVMSRSGVLKEIRGDLQFEDGDQVVVLSDSRDTRSIEALFRVGISYF